jgi:HD superfamily phosphohydrolase
MQRLRDVHQTGLAYHVYPSAHHSRFEHSLGTTIIASRIFDSVLGKQRTRIRDIVGTLNPTMDRDTLILRIKQELRLAALLHDTGHSIYSHTSERVYQKIELLVGASEELSSFVGKEKGAGEVISFCLVLTPAVARLLDKAAEKLLGDPESDDFQGRIDLVNVALILVGRSKHPFLQFLGDIVSSGFDADKLDYLLRDAKTAGLPLTYDLDRYLYDVRITEETLPDKEGTLQNLLSRAGTLATPRAGSAESECPYYDAYRLRLSRKAMNVIEQILICKMMLFSYIYHHGKVRAAEGILERLLNRCLDRWRRDGDTDEILLGRFLDMTDSCLLHSIADSIDDNIVKQYLYRLSNRLVPREVYNIHGRSATHARQEIYNKLLLGEQRDKLIQDLERAIGEELIKIQSNLGSDPVDALALAGVWVDAPKPPKFEDINEIVMGASSANPTGPVMDIFPICEWIQAYERYQYQVRIFSFSEYYDVTVRAVKTAMKQTLGIESDLADIRRVRE